MMRFGSNTNIDTHVTGYFKKILGYEKWMDAMPDPCVIDPFARNCQLAKEWSNDIAPGFNANYGMDALEFLKIVPSGIGDLVIFDPPFSSEQHSRNYNGDSISNVYTVPGYVSNCFKEICRILKPGGVVLKFGYNSNKDNQLLTLTRVYLVNTGGNRNDVIVSRWIRESNLGDFPRL